MFDRKRREPGVRRARTARVGIKTQLLEDIPVARARYNDLAMRLRLEIVAEGKCFRKQAGHSEDARIRRNAHHRTQCER